MWGLGLLELITVAGCGSDLSQTAAAPHSSVVTGAATTPAPSPTSSSAVTGPCTAQGTSEDPLTGLGATFAAWTAHHQVDPNRADFFLPFLNDGLDRYTQVLCTASGRIVAYHLNFIPPITLAAGRRALRGELPADAIVVYDTVRDGCQHIQYRSAALTRALGQADPDGVADATIILPSNPDQQLAVSTVFIDAKLALNVTPSRC
jgi:hypothetical protein